MERYTDYRKDEWGGIKDSILDGNIEEMMKIIFLHWRLTRRIGASKTSGSEG